jgi:hypothetical protein
VRKSIQNVDYDYIDGSTDGDDDERIEWCILKDCKASITTFVRRLFEKKRFVYHNQQARGQLQLVLTGDKGGDTVKMQIVFTNTAEPQVTN